MKASDFEALPLMPRWGYNTDPKLPVYNYSIEFRPKPAHRERWGCWNLAQKMPFTGTSTQAREAAAAFHQLMCIKHGLEE